MTSVSLHYHHKSPIYLMIQHHPKMRSQTVIHLHTVIKNYLIFGLVLGPGLCIQIALIHIITLVLPSVSVIEITYVNYNILPIVSCTIKQKFCKCGQEVNFYNLRRCLDEKLLQQIKNQSLGHNLRQYGIVTS